MAMGLCSATFCDFVAFTFDGLVIVRTQFNEAYFISPVQKLNDFYKEYMLPKILGENFKASDE